MTEKPMPTLRTSNALYLLNGRDLFSKPQSRKDDVVQQICQYYVNHVNENYGENAKVVFDGYPDEPATEDTTHLKRTKREKED